MKPAGIYIHIPFCRARCSYCDFATGAYESALAERYVHTVASEIESFHPSANTHDANTTREADAIRAEATSADATLDVDTIYFGGGTPSLLKPAQVARILEAVHKRFRVACDAEVTMEMNPGTVTLDTLRSLARSEEHTSELQSRQ